MNWTLLVPGALLPPRLAPELARAMRAPALANQLALARPMPPLFKLESTAQPFAPFAPQAAHWNWLARSFGLDGQALVTAPYAWRAAADAGAQSAAPVDDMWIAHCEPVHLAIARDHFVVTDLGDAPLLPQEAADLLGLANAVLAGEPAGAAPPLQLAVRGGLWFLLSPTPLQLKTWSLDAVLGQSIQDRLPVDTGTGADARRWRVLANEIQMSWHASRTADAREDAGIRAANALWLHGGGIWRRLDAIAMRNLRADPATAEHGTLRGWLQAAGHHPTAGSAPADDRRTGGGAEAGADTLSVCRDLFWPYAHQAWESWLERLPLVEARIECEMQAARAAGAHRFDLVLCGAVASRAVTLPLQARWWRRLRANAHAPATVLQRWLTEMPSVAAADSRPDVRPDAGATHGARAA
jgi:hypothetical protein